MSRIFKKYRIGMSIRIVNENYNSIEEEFHKKWRVELTLILLKSSAHKTYISTGRFLRVIGYCRQSGTFSEWWRHKCVNAHQYIDEKIEIHWALFLPNDHIYRLAEIKTKPFFTIVKINVNLRIYSKMFWRKTAKTIQNLR